MRISTSLFLLAVAAGLIAQVQGGGARAQDKVHAGGLFAPDQDNPRFTSEYPLEAREAQTREQLAVERIFGMHHEVTTRETVLTALDTFITPKAAASALVAPAALKPAIQSLAFFQGRWACDGKFLQSGKTISATETFRADLAGNWLVMRHDDAPPYSWHSLAVWGYDAKAGQFSYYNFDNFANLRHYTSNGWSGEKLVWTWSNVSPGSDPDRFVFDRHGDSDYQMTYYRSLGGQSWEAVDSSVCRRQ